jgi:hypothetical protein
MDSANLRVRTLGVRVAGTEPAVSALMGLLRDPLLASP